MDDQIIQNRPIAPATEAVAATTTTTPVEELLTDELLVEEISIDGMCGVY